MGVSGKNGLGPESVGVGIPDPTSEGGALIPFSEVPASGSAPTLAVNRRLIMRTARTLHATTTPLRR